ncbi:acid protease [Meredithblackwellia eburnea MCA 4105]
MTTDIGTILGKVLAGKGGNRGSNRKNGNGNATGAGTASSSSTTSNSNSTSSGSGTGFSQVDLDAATDNTVSAASTPTSANSLGLDIEANDVGYFATLQIGTPPADFKILMDSGSADFWVPSTSCTNCGRHQALGSDVSSSFQASTSNFQVTYGTGNVAGTIIKDDVNIAGLQLTGHIFGVTTDESQEFSSSSVPFDGLMGLAQSTLSNQGVLTPIESLAQAGTVTSAQMGYHLARLSDGNNDGEITFGGVDSTKFSGTLAEFSNVNTQGFWEGALEDVTVNGASLGLNGRTAILDTGTTLIVAPSADAEAIHAAIPGAASDGNGGFTIPCTSTATVALSFGGQSFKINPTDLTFLPVTNDLQGDCVSGISAGQIGGANEWLVGDVFLKNVYFATDVASSMLSPDCCTEVDPADVILHDTDTIGLAPSLQ